MRRTAASALLVLLALAPFADARSPAETAARALRSDPVYVHPGATERLTVPEQGRVRLAIVREAIGRIKVAVVPDAVAQRSGGIGEFAADVNRDLDVRGTLIAVAGPHYWALTSYPQSGKAAAALRDAVFARDHDRLAAELLQAIPPIARIDPGPAADAPRDGAAPGEVNLPDADNFLDDIGDAFRLGVLIVAIGLVIPLVISSIVIVGIVRRRRARAREVSEFGERSADDELVALGEEIGELDIDTSMPDANRAALTEYEQAIASYDQANELLEGDPTDYRVEQARAAIAAGKRHLAAARERL